MFEYLENEPPILTEWCEDYTLPLFRFSLGAYGWTRVLVFAQSLESGLEMVGEWCAKHAPGHLTQPDYAEAAEDIGSTWRPGADTDPPQEVIDAAEADLTYTESGWIVSHEWHVDEITDATARRIVALRASDASED